MKKLIEKFTSSFLNAKLGAKKFISDERGDTNFISIAIILVVVIMIAVVFIAFGQQILGALQGWIAELTGSLPTAP